MGIAAYRNDGEDYHRIRNARYLDTTWIKARRVVALGEMDLGYGTLFDGNGDYGVIPYHALQAWVTNGSLEAELYLPNFCAGGFAVSKGSDVATGHVGWGLFISFSPGGIEGSCATTEGTYGTQYAIDYAMRTTGRWIKARVEFIQGVTLKLYIDGILRGTVNFTTSYPLRYDHDSRIGVRPIQDWMTYCNGAVKNIKFFNGDTLINHYPMDDDPATGIFRDIINSVHATRYGNPTKVQYASNGGRLNL